VVELQFFGGVGEIGGNKILLEDGDARIWLDFGQSFTWGEEFFTGFLGYRGRFGLRDPFALGLMPQIPGLYSEEALAPTDFPPRPSEFSGVVLSHVHFDHSNHVKFLDPDIPIHLGEGTRHIMDSWEATSKVNFGDRRWETFRTGDRFDVDGVEVEPIHVDHSVPGAYGHLLHTSAGTVVYTGDLRRHGPHSHMTDDFIRRAGESEPVALICEGTRVMPEETRANYSEEGVRREAVRIVEDARGKLVVVTFYPRDVDRIKTFCRVAKDTGRTLLLSPRTAHLLETLSRDPGIRVPDVQNDPAIRIYRREMTRYDAWEREFRDLSVDAEYVRTHQGDLMLQLDFFQLTELVDIQPVPGSPFIHSKSEPFEEEDIEEEVKLNWLDRFGLVHHQLHASGHCSMGEIAEAIREIGPEVVYPIHTEFPGLFADLTDAKVVEPELNKTFALP
jgi:ribonuclease J